MLTLTKTFNTIQNSKTSNTVLRFTHISLLLTVCSNSGSSYLLHELIYCPGHFLRFMTMVNKSKIVKVYV
jgi:hypothetical protein